MKLFTLRMPHWWLYGLSFMDVPYPVLDSGIENAHPVQSSNVIIMLQAVQHETGTAQMLNASILLINCCDYFHL